MAEINDWNVAAGSNTSAVPDGWPEGMTSSQINNTAREGMAVVKRAWSDSVEGDKDSTGSSNAYLVAANRVLSAYYDGMRIGFHASFANTDAATLDVDSVGAKAIVKYHDVALTSGDIEANQYIEVVFSATDDAWQLQTPVSSGADLVSDTSPQLGGDLDLNGNNIDFPTTANISDCLDEDDMSTNSATMLATQQSIKAYVDSKSITLTAEQTGTGSETEFDFTGIPAGTKWIIINFEGLSLSGTDNIIVLLGDAGGLEATGYVATAGRHGNGGSPAISGTTTEFNMLNNSAAYVISGHMHLRLSEASNFTWAQSHVCKATTTATLMGGGNKDLSAELTQIRVTRSGTNTFDGGAVSIQYGA